MQTSIVFNGQSCQDIGLLVAKKINMPVPQEKVTTYTIPSRDGDLIVREGVYEDIEIEITFNFFERTDWELTFRKAKRWLLKKNDMKLYIKPNGGGYYKVKNVSVSTTERLAVSIGSFSTTFTCDPYLYIDGGDEPTTISTHSQEIATDTGSNILTNSGNEITTSESQGSIENLYEICHPIYVIGGNADGSIEVNGNIIDVRPKGVLIVDTDRKISYLEDGTFANSSITGDYEDLWLQEGENRIIASNNIDVQIIPMWRCI